MMKGQVLCVLILILCLSLPAACMPETPLPGTPTPQPTATPTPEPLPPEEVLLAYFKTLNTKDFWAAYEYRWHSQAETKETYHIQCLPVGWGATYTSIEITPYVKILETANVLTQYHDKGDIEGQCERFIASYWLDFPEGFGAGPPGEYCFMYTLVFYQNEWKIIESGAATSNSCIRAMETLSNEE